MELFTELLSSLIKLSPIVGLLLFAIWYLHKENKTLKEDNKDLNKYVREMEHRNTQILSGVTSTLDKLVDRTDNNLDQLKEWLNIKLENLKK